MTYRAGKDIAKLEIRIEAIETAIGEIHKAVFPERYKKEAKGG